MSQPEQQVRIGVAGPSPCLLLPTHRIVIAVRQTVEDLKQRADDAHRTGNHRVAIKLYNRAIKLDPQSHILYSNRSAAKAAAGNRWSEALEDAEKVILALFSPL
jgi:tetratricopeptide (TPR) repeat protein